jgi:hypothetical protein
MSRKARPVPGTASWQRYQEVRAQRDALADERRAENPRPKPATDPRPPCPIADGERCTATFGPCGLRCYERAGHTGKHRTRETATKSYLWLGSRVQTLEQPCLFDEVER